MTYNRLYNHSYQWSCQPEPGEVFNIGAKCAEYPGSISVLQCKSKLDTKKAEAHIEYLPEVKFWLTQKPGNRILRSSRHSSRLMDVTSYRVQGTSYKLQGAGFPETCNLKPVYQITNPSGSIAPFFTTTIPSFTVYKG